MDIKSEVKNVEEKVEGAAKGAWKKVVGVVAVIGIAAGALFSDCGSGTKQPTGTVDASAVVETVDAAPKTAVVDAGVAPVAPVVDAAAAKTDASK
jgi:hypothetical protein